MTQYKHPFFNGSDHKGQPLENIEKVQLNQDAVNADEAVRKSQAESISDQAAQDILIELSASADSQSAFTSQSIVGFLAAKQDNLEVHPSSAAYLEIVDGYKIKATQLLIQSVIVDESNSTLADYITNESPTNQEGDVIILTQATDNQERSWIKTGAASQLADGYTRLQTDYNIQSIRAMFSGGAYLTYDVANGVFGLALGNSTGQVGAHTVPVDGTLFNVVTGTTVLGLMQALETYIAQVDTNATGGQTTIDTRLTTLSGTTTNNLGTFTGGVFSNNSSIKGVLIESEAAHLAATTDRASIRAEFTASDNTLNALIQGEAATRIAADNTLQSNIDSEASSRTSADNTLQSNIDSEATSRIAADNAQDARLDIIEGSSTTTGSIAKAQADAQTFATASVASEAAIRASTDTSLQLQIDAISSAFLYKGYINADGRIVHIDSLHPNNNVLFENATLYNGDFYKVNASVTITFGDSSSITVEPGDGILAIEDIAAGNANATHVHITDNTEAADILREGELESGILERTGGVIKIVDDSLTRAKLAAAVETDIDNKVLKAGDEMTGSLKIDKTVTAGTGYAGGYDYSLYVKMKSVDTASLTDTQRSILIENDVYTNGSGNQLDLDYANAATIASHYKGGSSDLTLATVGLNAEANVTLASSSIYATGVYGLATSSQLGVNAGGTFVAQNAALSNLGMFAFSDTAGAANNRAGYFALSTDALDFDSYRVARVAQPLPVQDAAIIIDDYTGVKHAAYINGKVEIGGPAAKLIIPSASANNEAVNLGDIKSKEHRETFTIPAAVGSNSGTYVINHQLGSEEIILDVWHDGQLKTHSFVIRNVGSDGNAIEIFNDSTDVITDAKIYIRRLS